MKGLEAAPTLSSCASFFPEMGTSPHFSKGDPPDKPPLYLCKYAAHLYRSYGCIERVNTTFSVPRIFSFLLKTIFCRFTYEISEIRCTGCPTKHDSW